MKKLFMISILTFAATAVQAEMFPSITHLQSIYAEESNRYEFTFVGSSEVKTGSIYMVSGGLIDDANGYINGAVINGPLLLTTTSKLKPGEYIPFAADEKACAAIAEINAKKVEMKTVPVKSSQKVVAIQNGKLLVGTPDQLFKVTGKRITEIVKSLDCDSL
ncbi:MAG: hypothetical protein JSU04_11920 [Bdellovibrionales bacterium]|nr:hypothetical protein [Bdellovibrionales bacterium]